MKRVRLNLKLALIGMVQLSILSCNNEDITDNRQANDGNTAYGSIYAGPATGLSSKKIFSSSMPNAKISSNCIDSDDLQSKTFDNFSKFGTGTHLMWPGNLIQGNSIRTGELASIPIGENGRNSIEVKVDAFSSSATVSSSQVIENPTAGKVQNALETALGGYYTSGTSFPANYTIDIRRAFSSKQLQLALNVGYTGAEGVNVGASFGINFNEKKNYYAVTLKQKFFNVSVYPKPSLKGDLGWVKSNYPENEINNYISQDNPPLYISSVTYGRLYTLVYESSESSFELEQALNFAYKNPTTSVTADQKLKYSTTLQNSRIYVKQLGGNATAGLLTAFESQAGNFDKIRDFVVSGAEVSKSNPGYPIEYSAAHIGTNQPVTIKVEEMVKNRECRDTPYIANTYDDAKAGVDKLKSEYGTGNSAKIIIYNNTNKEMVLKSETSWYGSSFYNIPPPRIASGKYGFALAVHKAGEATGTFNQISYLLEDKTMSFGTYAPWSQLKTNNVLVNFNEISEQDLYNNSTRPSIEKVQGNTRIRGRIDTDDSPFVFFTVTQ